MKSRYAALGIIGAAWLNASCAAVWGFSDAVLGDAGSSDAMDSDAPNVDADVKEASATVEASPDAPVDPPPPAPDAAREAAAPPPTCMPACGGGYSCMRAVGGASACVAASGTCTDSAQCPVSTCCVWLEPESATGRCEAPGFPGSVMSSSCLCTGSSARPMDLTCKKCVAPTTDPGSPVLVCSGGP